MRIRLLSAQGRAFGPTVGSALLLGALLVTACLLLPASALALTSTGDGGWSWQDPLSQGDRLEAISVIDAQHAVAVGDCGAILTTADAGASWASHDPGIAGAHFNGVSFADANDGWAVVWVLAQNGGRNAQFIAHTSDGGATWATQTHAIYAHAVDFVDADRGWVCGGNTVWSTADGGLTWRARHLRSNWYLNAVAFTDASHGWVVGYRETDHGSHYYPIIMVTSDGGITWSQQSFPAGDTEGRVLNSVSFVDAAHGWAVGNGSSMGGGGTIIVTSDGGLTWQSQASGTTDWDLNDVTFVDASHGWLTGGGKILATIDGGATWTPQTVGIGATAVAFADSLQGYAVGTDGGIATTTDGGVNWQVRSSASPATGVPLLADITFPDPDHGWAVGRKVILATADGGATWNAQTASSGLASVSFPDAVHGWAVGGGNYSGVGVILHTADGGLSWQTQYTGASALAGGLNDIASVDADHAWVASASAPTPLTKSHPLVLGTSDAGAHWDSVTLSRAPGAASAISFVDARHGWLVSSAYDLSSSSIFVTSDGGLTWKLQYTTGANVALRDVAFTDAHHGWAVGQSENLQGVCLVLTTNDGGASWSRRNLSSEGVFAGMHVTFTDQDHGWVVCGSVIYATVDGGRHWWRQRVGAEVRSVAFIDSSHGWALAETADWLSGNGGILTTTTGGFSPAPVTTVSGAYQRWHRTAVRLAFKAVDEPGGAGMAGGQARIETRIDGGAWTATGTGLTIPAPKNHSNDGVHTVFYRAVDAAGNIETARNVMVRIDTRGPITAARAVVGMRGQTVRLSYRIADLSPRAAAVKLVIRSASGFVVKSFSLGSANTNLWLTLNWKPAFKGRFAYTIYANDLAGNAQAHAGRATVTIR
jgi:photosystem II stability/assembly factor-like uncharacterized protein